MVYITVTTVNGTVKKKKTRGVMANITVTTVNGTIKNKLIHCFAIFKIQLMTLYVYSTQGEKDIITVIVVWSRLIPRNLRCIVCNIYIYYMHYGL